MKTPLYIQKRQALSGKYLLGIDPGKESHMAMLVDPAGFPRGSHFSFRVDHDGFTQTRWHQLRQRLAAYGPDTLVVAVETSCNLWQTLAAYLQAQGYTVLLISPLTTHDARPRLNHDFSKTDPKDAFLIAQEAQQGQYDRYVTFTPDVEALHRLSITYAKLRKDKTRLVQRLRAFMALYFPEYPASVALTSQTSQYLLTRFCLPSHFQALDIATEAPILERLSRHPDAAVTLQALQQAAATSIGLSAQGQEAALRLVLDGWLAALAQVQAQLRQVRQAMISLARQDPTFPLLTSIPNIGATLAALLIAETRGPARYTHAKQLEKAAGLNLVLAQSGQSRSVRQISSIGNSRLRWIIYQRTVQTAKVVPVVRCRFLRCRLQQKPYRQSIVAATAPLLTLLVALLQEQRPYQEQPAQERTLAQLEQVYAAPKRRRSAHQVA
jgi:transposase